MRNEASGCGPIGSALRAQPQAGHASVDRERGPRDGTGGRRGEVADGLRHFLGVTRRPWGCRAARAACSPSGSSDPFNSRSTQGVFTVPGFTAFTRMPSARRAAAMARVRARTAPLVAEYRARSGRPAVAAMEATFTMAAHEEARRLGRTDRVTRTCPTTLMFRTRCHSESGLSSTPPWAPTPALLTRMSSPPSASDAACAAAVTEGVSPMSPWTKKSSPPVGGCRSRTATCAPWSASWRAVASPMPDDPPVTSALVPAKAPMSQPSRQLREWLTGQVLGCTVTPVQEGGLEGTAEGIRTEARLTAQVMRRR